MPVDQLRQSTTMSHLLDALDKGQDIGHYGRLTFAMVAHHYMDQDELVQWLMKDKDTGERKARALVDQVAARDYNPPRRERILEWQAEQDFKIIPDADDPDAGNLYRELDLPDDVYKDIEEYHAERQESHSKG